ncbi:MAG TPA: TetR/AcrR family transcriptional regulator C-terminal domain-containing protein [Lachnospiraceae bacterium]|nr:TetR/AcrR family transcriptional regulator C-terminal domain-containing protein [Lachnospiraceae bacterium]
MEEKKDIEHELAASLKRLAVREPFEKITIKQITDGAGVIRVTFYNHFQDKYDLLEWIVRNEILDPIHILLTNRMYKQAVVLIFTNLQNDKEFYRHIVSIEGQNSFTELGQKSIYSLLIMFFKERAGNTRPKHPWMEPEYLAEYYAQSMTYVVVNWIKSGMAVSPEEMATAYEYIATRSMWDVLDELGKETS